jgi:hypothetical protein
MAYYHEGYLAPVDRARENVTRMTGLYMAEPSPETAAHLIGARIALAQVQEEFNRKWWLVNAFNCFLCVPFTICFYQDPDSVRNNLTKGIRPEHALVLKETHPELFIGNAST